MARKIAARAVAEFRSGSLPVGPGLDPERLLGKAWTWALSGPEGTDPSPRDRKLLACLAQVLGIGPTRSAQLEDRVRSLTRGHGPVSVLEMPSSRIVAPPTVASGDADSRGAVRRRGPAGSPSFAMVPVTTFSLGGRSALVALASLLLVSWWLVLRTLLSLMASR